MGEGKSNEELLAILEESRSQLEACSVFATAPPSVAPAPPSEPEPEPEPEPESTIDASLVAALEKQASLADATPVTFGSERMVRQSWCITNASSTATPIAAIPKSSPRKHASEGSAFILEITVRLAEDVPAQGCSRNMPSQCVLYMREGEFYSTRPRAAPLKWQETFELEVPRDSSNKITFEVWRGATDLVGKATVLLENIGSTLEEIVVPLSSVGTRRGQPTQPAGRLHCGVRIVPLDPSMAKLLEFVTGNKFIQHSIYDLVKDGQDGAAGALLNLCYSKNVALPLLVYAVEKEAKAGGLATIQSSATLRKMLGMFTKYARESYIDDYVRPTIYTIHRSSFSLEIRKSRLGDEDPAENQANLEKFAQEILDKVVETAGDLPFAVKVLCQHIHSALEGNAAATRETLGDLLFQRFLCPAIAAPKASGLVSSVPTMAQKQGYVLLAKVLANAAISRPFPASSELAVMNGFIARNDKVMEKTWAAIAAQQETGISAILASKKRTKEFLSFLKKQHSEENLRFYQEVSLYRSKAPNERMEYAKHIHNSFVATGSVNEVNLDGGMRKKIEERLDSGEADIFDEAQKWTFTLLSGDCYVKFLQAPRRPTTIIGSLGNNTSKIMWATKLSKFLVDHLSALQDKAEAENLEEYVYSVSELAGLLGSLSEDYNPTKGVRVMNRSAIWSGKVPRPAWPVAADCLTQVIAIYRSFFADGTVTDQTVTSMRQSAEFKDFVRSTSELQAVNVEYLSHNQKLAFWINTFNMMALHAYVEIGQPNSDQDWLNLQQQAVYEVAGNHYSMLQVEHSILRAQMAPAKWLKGTAGTEKFHEGEPQKRCALQKAEKLLCFTLCNGALQNPHLRVYHPGMSQKEIVQVASQVLASTTSFNEASKEVVVPKVLYWYYKDVCNDKKKALRAVVDMLMYDSNRTRLLGYLRNKPKIVFNEEAAWTFNPVFLDSSS